MVDWGAPFKLWMIFCSSENTVLVRLRARAVAASTQTRYGMVRDMTRKQNSNQIGVQHTARILSRYQCARAGARAPAKYITYNKEDIWLTGERRSNYGWFFCSSENTVSRETARPCSGSIYANQLRDGKRMTRKQNSNQIEAQHTARILSRYQCARARAGGTCTGKIYHL